VKLNLEEIQYRLRTDNEFKKKLRKYVLIGGAGVILVAVLALVGIVFFSSAIISFLYTNAPAVYELGFNYVRDFAGTFMQEDMAAILNPLTGGANVEEMKNLVTQYFNQLSSNPAIDFQNFQNFITTVKSSLLDNQISNTELELVRQFILN